MTKLVREAELQACITERLSAQHDPAHAAVHLRVFPLLPILFPSSVNYVELDLCHVHWLTVIICLFSSIGVGVR